MTDTGGKVLAQASAGYAVTSAVAGYAESEPADWWSAVTACAREAVDARPARGPSAIGLSGQMHGLVLASADGEALRPALLWADSRATGRCAPTGASARARWPGWPTRWPRDDRAAAHVGRRARTAHLPGRALGAAAQGLAAGPPYRRDPRRAQRRVRQPALRRAGRPLGPRGGQRAGPGRRPAGAAAALGRSARRAPHRRGRGRAGAARGHPGRGRGRRHGGGGPRQRRSACTATSS